VVSLDVVGRGKSDWLDVADSYSYATYVPDTVEFIEYICKERNVEKIDFIGTSMGGLIGMMLKSFNLATGQRIRRMVINDVGASITAKCTNRLRDTMLKYPTFADLAEAEKYINERYSTGEELSTQALVHLVKHLIVQAGNGRYRLHYDPSISQVFGKEAAVNDVPLWDFWKSVTCPVLLLHGVNSDLLTDELIVEMQKVKPTDMQVIHFPNCGHAPSLMDKTQIRTVVDYLLHK